MNNNALAQNLESWQQRTPIHLRSAMYRRGMDILREGGITLSPPTDTEIGDIRGKRVLHLQCHIGLDTMSLARLGAEMTALDFSPAALAAAGDLAEELGHKIRFVLSDSQRADEVLDAEQFDMVFASFGVFCWIGDLGRWLRSAYKLLKPGGLLYIADFHPFLWMIDDGPAAPDGVEFRYSYFDREPQSFPPGRTYADDGAGKEVAGTVEFMHTLGDMVTVAAQSGFRIEYLHEFKDIDYQHYDSMVKAADGTWDFPPPLAGKFPKIFSLRATK